MAHDILIVDDEADIRRLIAGVLEDEGYDAREAADGRGALEALKAMHHVEAAGISPDPAHGPQDEADLNRGIGRVAGNEALLAEDRQLLLAL